MITLQRSKRLVETTLLLTMLLLILNSRQTLVSAEEGPGGHTTFLPYVGREIVNLKSIGQVNLPTDITGTSFGVLVSEAQSYVRNLTAGQDFLDLSLREAIARIQSITVRDDFLYTLYVVYEQEPASQYLSRFQITGGVADPDSEQILIALPISDDAEHLGGDLNFGPDGYLYVSTGDGSPQGDPEGHAQDNTNLFGSILRLDVTGGGLPADCNAVAVYTIPPDNPFVDGAGGACDEIWAIGFRQPWRVSFDRQTGDFWTTDVGLAQREEINFQPAASTGGENYGWRCYEGSVPFNLSGCDQVYQFPEYEYNHSNGRCAIMGGFVYRGTMLSTLIGKYIFADYCSGEILAYDPVMGTAKEITRRESTSWTTFGEGPDGELYIADYETGRVFRLQLSPY
jgi:glucose/arabinose dehydrogenase